MPLAKRSQSLTTITMRILHLKMACPETNNPAQSWSNYFEKPPKYQRLRDVLGDSNFAPIGYLCRTRMITNAKIFRTVLFYSGKNLLRRNN